MSKLQVDDIVNKEDTGSPGFSKGVVVTGVCTATSFDGNITGTAATFTGNVSVGGTLTYEDVTNVDSVGIVTAGKGFRATTGGIIVTSGISTLAGTIISGITTIDASGVNVTGVATATKFSGPGNIPGNVTTGTYTIVAADAGKLVSATGTVTLPAATFEVGDAISVYNNTGSDMTLTCSAPTAVYLGSDGSTVTSLTLALRCICTFVCVDTASNDTFVATGGGLS